MPLLITAGAVFLLIIFVSVWRLNALLSLLIVSVVTALALGVPAVKITSVLEHGMGSTLGHIALLFGLGAMLGRLLAGGGGGRRIAFGLVEFSAKSTSAGPSSPRHLSSASPCSSKWGLFSCCQSFLRQLVK